MRYSIGDCATSIQRTQNLNSVQQQIHSQIKSNTETNENVSSQFNELLRSSSQVTSAIHRDTR